MNLLPLPFKIPKSATVIQHITVHRVAGRPGTEDYVSRGMDKPKLRIQGANGKPQP